MRRKSGFTLIELLVTIAVFGILAALTAPNIIAWMSNTKIQKASREILSAFQDARQQAVKSNTEVVVSFQTGTGRSGTYEVFVDNGSGGGTAGNSVRDGSEPVTSSGHAPPGIEIEDAQTGRIAFNSRGFTKNFATLTVSLKNGRGDVYRVEVISSGLARIVRG